MKRREIVLLVLCILQALLIIWYMSYKIIGQEAYKALYLQDYPKAIRLYHKAIRLQPAYASGYINLADALRQSGDEAGALDAARKAVEINPRNGEYLQFYGGMLTGKGEYEEAEKQLKEAIKWGPYDPLVYIYLADNQYNAFKPLKEVDANCTKALQLEGNMQMLLNTIIASSISQGNTTEAAAMCRLLLSYTPEHEWLHYQLGRATQKNKK